MVTLICLPVDKFAKILIRSSQGYQPNFPTTSFQKVKTREHSHNECETVPASTLQEYIYIYTQKHDLL